MADRWLRFERENVRGWYEAAGLGDVEVDCAAERCSTATPKGQALALSVFVAYGRKG